MELLFEKEETNEAQLHRLTSAMIVAIRKAEVALRTTKKGVFDYEVVPEKHRWVFADARSYAKQVGGGEHSSDDGLEYGLPPEVPASDVEEEKEEVFDSVIRIPMPKNYRGKLFDSSEETEQQDQAP